MQASLHFPRSCHRLIWTHTIRLISIQDCSPVGRHRNSRYGLGDLLNGAKTKGAEPFQDGSRSSKSPSSLNRRRISFKTIRAKKRRVPGHRDSSSIRYRSILNPGYWGIRRSPRTREAGSKTDSAQRRRAMGDRGAQLILFRSIIQPGYRRILKAGKPRFQGTNTRPVNQTGVQNRRGLEQRGAPLILYRSITQTVSKSSQSVLWTRKSGVKWVETGSINQTEPWKREEHEDDPAMVTYKLLPLESGSSQSVVEDKLAKQDSGGQVLQPSRKGGARRRLRLRRNLVNPHSVVKEKFTKQGSGGQILQPSLEDVASRRSRPRVPKKTPKSSENCYPGSTEVVLSPPSILAQWLDIDDIAERESYWLKFRKYAKLNKMDSTLPIILLQYIAKTTRPDAILDDLGQELWNRAMSTLRNAGFNTDDVAKWAWVVSPHDGEEMATRFLFLPLKNPPLFLLLHILRKDISRVKTLKKLLIYIWKHIMGKSSAYDDPLSGQEISVGSPSPAVMQALSIYTESEPDAPILKETEYTVMITRLLRQCRRLWPAAVLSVSYAVGPIMDSILAESSGDPKNLDRRMHRKLCHLFNYTLTRLSLPAATEPMKSMAHNWQAQKVLLNLAGQFQPPLFLNGSAYRAVVRVLAAQKKTEREAMVSNRRSRSWPPWRIEQDGMDTCRELADDLSRSVLAAMRMTESGYREDDRVRALKILGGQESDGTPTIQTRKLPGPWNRMQEWAARIEATRDVEEAWSAFVNFRQQQGKPSLSMYFAMIQKLQHEIARTRRGVEYDASPGDGREVLPPSHDNFSTFYCRQLQPPSVKELYKQMITESHQRPTGRFLSYMVSNARTPQEGLWYLQRSNISNEAIQFLRTGRGDVPNLVEQLNDDIFAAFIKLLCRFALRSEASNQSRDFKDFFVNPLLHCHQILKRSQIRFRPAWYELFEGLSRRDIIVDRDIDDRFQNDIFSWQVTAAALDDFHQLGLELDHRGFQIICRGFEKAAVASSHPGYEQLFAQSQIRILKERFAEISEALPWGCEYGIPRLLFPIGGAHLHPYVRVLGVIKDYDEIIHLLEWMVENHKPLNDSVSQSRNNAKMVRNTIVAMKVFLNDTEFENRAQELVERVEAWDGWPSDREVQAYLSKNTATYAGNNFEEEEFDQEEDLKPSKEAGAES